MEDEKLKQTWRTVDQSISRGTGHSQSLAGANLEPVLAELNRGNTFLLPQLPLKCSNRSVMVHCGPVDPIKNRRTSSLFG